jgi:methionyl-tRNA synthetase
MTHSQANNSELANTLGNLVNRATNLTAKYCGGVVPVVACALLATFDLIAAHTFLLFSCLCSCQLTRTAF